MRLKALFSAIGLALASISAVLAAQDTGTVVHMDGPGVLAQVVVAPPRVAQLVDDRPTVEQARALAAGNRFMPGVYRIRSVLSGHCLAATGDANAFILGDCSVPAELAATNQFAILPHPRGGYTVRLHPYRALLGGRANSANEIGNCATIARGVVFGAARIEAKPCDIDGSEWVMAGVIDQRFSIQPISKGSTSYQLSMMEFGDAPDCWVLRGGSREIRTEVIRWQCANTPDQAWQFEWVGPLLREWEPRLLEQTQWYWTDTGHRNITRASGIELLGDSLASFSTISDGGEKCSKICTGNPSCNAWTWTAQGYGNSPRAMCHFKGALYRAVNRGSSFNSAVASGIVRP